MKYAGFWLRVCASIIDGVILMVGGFVGGGVIGFVLGFALAAAGSFQQQEIQTICGIMGGAFGMVLNWLYYTLLEASGWQATLGKKALGLKVETEGGKRISWGVANARYWSKIISALILFIGFLMAAFTEKKQALHDKIAGTLVVR